MRATVTCVVLAVVFAIGTMALAEPTVTIYTDKSSYQPSDTIEVSLSAANDDEAMSVDVYIGFILPNGDIWSTQYDGWSHFIEPWIPDIYVPASFEMAPTAFWTFDLPCAAPPIEGAGDYAFATVLTYPGTFGWVSDASLAPFTYGSGGRPTDVTMISIPAGSFLMGSPEDERWRHDDEGPQRTVNISAFQMSETEITEKQWIDTMDWNDCYYKRGDYYPVESVTWYDCVSFCNKLSEADGLTKCYTITNFYYSGNHITFADVSCNFGANGYRLPTEAEWEYACRAGTSTLFYTGDSYLDLDRAGWYSGNSGSQKREVGQKQANAFGLYDMHGNCDEWCWDWYSWGYYGTRPDPDSDPTGASSGPYRVARGGRWTDYPWVCRSACRRFDVPAIRSYSLGFRVLAFSAAGE